MRNIAKRAKRLKYKLKERLIKIGDIFIG